ncbi:MAG: helix-turn-helix domain-containing protein, partial [Candidatus Binataceae bacterium]
KRIGYIAGAALAALKRYDWPGNVREFGHAIQSAVMLSEGDRIELAALPETVRCASAASAGVAEKALAGSSEAESGEINPSRVPGNSETALQQPANGSEQPLLLDEVIKRTLLRSLDETDGNRRRAAGLLGISRSTLYRMLARYGLEQEGGRHRNANREPVTGI